LMGDRRSIGPWGLSGGEPGSTGEDWLVRANGTREKLPGKCTIDVAAGDELIVLTPGGGGWGPARVDERPTNAVRSAATVQP